jgi:hypothetical protein
MTLKALPRSMMTRCRKTGGVDDILVFVFCSAFIKLLVSLFTVWFFGTVAVVVIDAFVDVWAVVAGSVFIGFV